jgi:hypothetical protein
MIYIICASYCGYLSILQCHANYTAEEAKSFSSMDYKYIYKVIPLQARCGPEGG